MTIDPLLEASAAVRIHVAFIVIALIVTPVQLSLKRGSLVHKRVGRIWMGAMAGAALASFFIVTHHPVIGPFGLLHILSVTTLASIIFALWALRRGYVIAHAVTLLCLVTFALIGSGLFTFLPGRIMARVFFSG